MMSWKTTLPDVRPEVIEADEVIILDEDGAPIETDPFEAITAAQLKSLNGAVRRVTSAFEAPEDLTVSEWAEKKRRLSRESSAEAGRYRVSRTPYLREVMDAFTDAKIRRISLVAASQIGKALDVNTPIPTPDGWKTMGELKVGDTVFDETGNACTVLFATEVMHNRKCYRLTFSDGSEIVADADHRWMVDEDTRHGLKKELHHVLTTDEIAGRSFYMDKDGRRHNRFSIPVASALNLPEVELPMPPYTLGVWLGDGNSHSAELTTAVKDSEILDYIRAEGVKVQSWEEKPGLLTSILDPKISIHDTNFCIRGHDMRIVGRTKKGLCAECSRQHRKHWQYGFQMDPVINEQITGYKRLFDLGVLKNKHIPQMYLRASREQRLALLQGLMDTDGTVGKTGICEFVQKSKQLTDDVSELLNSLGIKHVIKAKKASCTYKENRYECEVYRIEFLCYAETPIFRLKRKFERMVSMYSTGPAGRPRRTSETLRRRIVSIEEAESVPVRCISVGSESHLYLAGKSMIPTHNTEAELCIIGYIIDQDPGSILFIHPTNIDAKEFSRLRIAPMIRDTPALRKKIRESRQRDSANTIMQKAFPGGLLTLCGSNEAHALASKPIRYVLGDERDRWAKSAGTEGDPWELAMARQKTFYNAKAVEVSTPTIKGSSPIADGYAEGTMERWCSQCPHCGKYHEITWNNIRYEHEETEVDHEKTYKVTSVVYVCPECGCISTESEMKKAPAHWEASNPQAMANGHRSFWLNAFVSPWESWSNIVLAWLRAQGNPLKMQVVYNTCFGLLWENRGDMMTEDELLGRREDWETELPDGVLVLTAGIDTQDDRMEYEILGHGHFGETWHIEYGQIMGRPDSDETWAELDAMVFDRVLHFGDGLGMKVSASFVDEGGHFTKQVRLQCQKRMAKHVFACKGRAGDGIPFTSPPKKMKIVIDDRYLGECWQYQIGVDSGKTMIFSDLSVRTHGPNYQHFPRRGNYQMAYFQGLLSEHLVYDEKKKNPWQWVKLPGHKRNEPLDLNNYARAAFDSLPVNLDEKDRKLKAARAARAGQKLPDGPTMKAPAPVRAPARKKPVKRGRGSGRQLDDW